MFDLRQWSLGRCGGGIQCDQQECSPSACTLTENAFVYTSWQEALQGALRETFADNGPQLKPIKLRTGCSGTGAASIATTVRLLVLQSKESKFASWQSARNKFRI